MVAVRSHVRALAVAAVLAAACGEGTPEAKGPPAWSSGGRGDRAARSGTEAESWFPLVDGNVFQYRTVVDDAPGGVLPLRAFRTSNRLGELRTPSGNRRFEYRDQGLAVLNKDGFWMMVFQVPVATGGPTWRGEHGGIARWDATDLAVEVPAGRFAGCARVVEERGGDRPGLWATTFCPGTGVVILEAAGAGAHERAELTYAGPPFDLGPEGTRRVQ